MSDIDLLVARYKAAGGIRAYKVGDVPATPVSVAYAVLGLDFGIRSSIRVSGDSGGLVRRLSVQTNGPSYDAVVDLVHIADAAFFDQTLTEIDRAPFCTRELSIGPLRDPDAEGSIYALNTYRF